MITVVVATAGVLGAASPRGSAGPWSSLVVDRGTEPSPVAPAPGPPISVQVPRSAFAALPPLTFIAVNGKGRATVQLFGDGGKIDEHAAGELDALLSDRRKPDDVRERPLDRRLLSLVARAAHHFSATEVEVVSAYRAPRRYREGLHAEGRAIDFRVADVTAKELATYLRKQPRAGVGQYIHPRTQYVHLDVRDVSFHWLDGTAPGRGSGAWRIPSLDIAELDASWTEESDAPERAP